MTTTPDNNYQPEDFAVISTIVDPIVEAQIMELENYLRENSDLDDYGINAACRLKRDLLSASDATLKLKLESQLFDIIHGENDSVQIRVLKTLNDSDGYYN